MNGRGLQVVNLLISLLALAASIAAIAVIVITNDEPAPADPVEAPVEPARVPDDRQARAPLPTVDGRVSAADVTARCLPSVVNVSTTRVTQDAPTGTFFDILRPFLGDPGPRESQSLGSGVIVDDAGIVLTNHHVIADATEIRVTFWDGREYPARSVGSDPESDVAVLRIDVPQGETLDATGLEYGDATELRQGDSVLAIGNPFGVGQTVTLGIVSATGRAAMGITDYEDFIQTDAAINPGNSGGALVNMRGELVGINTAILSRTGGSHGIGFAIPSNMAQPIAAALLRDGHVTRGWLGIALQDLNPQLARSIGARRGPRGVAVMDIDQTGPAAHADLQRGDVITSLDGEAIHSSRQLRNLVATRGAGTEITLVRERASSPGEVRVTLAERPDVGVALPTEGERAPAAAGADVAGLTLSPLTEALRRQYSIASDVSGVIVTATGRGPGTSAQIRVGDVITSVMGQRVDTPEAFRVAYESTFLPVMVSVRRGVDTRTFIVGH